MIVGKDEIFHRLICNRLDFASYVIMVAFELAIDEDDSLVRQVDCQIPAVRHQVGHFRGLIFDKIDMIGNFGQFGRRTGSRTTSAVWSSAAPWLPGPRRMC